MVAPPEQPSSESQHHLQALLESKDAEIDYLQQQLQNLSQQLSSSQQQQKAVPEQPAATTATTDNSQALKADLQKAKQLHQASAAQLTEKEKLLKTV